MNGWNSPMELLPPPTQAIAASATSRLLQHLLPRLPPITDWKSRTIVGNGCRADSRADQVVRRLDVRHPVAHRLVDGVLQGVLLPVSTGTTVAPSIFIRNTFSDCRLMSSLPM